MSDTDKTFSFSLKVGAHFKNDIIIQVIKIRSNHHTQCQKKTEILEYKEAEKFTLIEWQPEDDYGETEIHVALDRDRYFQLLCL